MKSTKCPQCGLVYWAADPNCKRCGLATGDASSVDASAQPQEQLQAQSAEYSQAPINHFGEDPAKAKLLKNIKSDATFFYIIGGIQTLAWFVIGELLIVDAALNIGLSFVVHKFKSRVAACFLLGVTLLAVLSGIVQIAAGERIGLLFPVAMILRLFAAGRMVHATFKLNGYEAEGPAKALPPPPPNFHPDANQQWSGANASPQLQSAE